MNTKFKVIGLTRLGIKPEFTAPEANARTTRPSEFVFIAGLLCVCFWNRFVVYCVFVFVAGLLCIVCVFVVCLRRFSRCVLARCSVN